MSQLDVNKYFLSPVDRSDDPSDDVTEEALRRKVTGPLTMHLHNLWNGEKRVALHRLYAGGNPSQNETISGQNLLLQTGLTKCVKMLILKTHDLMGQQNCILREILGGDVAEWSNDWDNAASASRSGRNRFFKKLTTNESVVSYSRLVGKALRTCYQWGGEGDSGETLRSLTGANFDASVVEILRRFHHRVKKAFQENTDGDDPDDLAAALFPIVRKVLLKFLVCKVGFSTSYAASPFCSCVVAALVRTDELSFSITSSAEKVVSAFKWVLRGAVALRVADLDQKERGQTRSLQFVEKLRPYLALTKFMSTISLLNSLQKAIGSFKPAMGRVVEIDHANSRKGLLRINNVSIGCDVLGTIVGELNMGLNNKLDELLFGKVDEWIENAKESFPAIALANDHHQNGQGDLAFEQHYERYQDTSVGFAFGRPGDHDDWQLLSKAVFADDERKGMFFNLKTKKPNSDHIKQYLQTCLDFEASALPLFHILSGAGNRAEHEFSSLLFRNVRDSTRSIKILDHSFVHVVGTSWKTNLLGNVNKSKHVLLPKKEFMQVLLYWAVVRPFATLLLNALYSTRRSAKGKETLTKIYGPLDKWNSHCFIETSAKKVRDTVKSKLPEGCTFQTLRHASEAIFRNFVVPAEQQLQKLYSFDTIFGHTYTTGLGYGQETLGSSNECDTAVDMAGLKRIFKSFWSLLNLPSPALVQTNNSVDDDGDDDDDGGESMSEAENGESTSEAENMSEVGFMYQDDDGNCDGACNSVGNDGNNDDDAAAAGDDDDDDDDDDDESKSVAEKAETDCESESESESERSLVCDDDAKDMVQLSPNDYAEIKNAMSKLTMPSFKSLGQARLVFKSVDNNASLLAVLPTGAGKSASFLVPAMMRRNHVRNQLTVVVYPLGPVYFDMQRRLQQSPLGTQEWTVFRDNARNSFSRNETKLLLVRADQVHRSEFQNLIRDLVRNHWLARIVVDEAQLFVTSESFRRTLCQVPLILSNLAKNAQIILLSATVPKSMEQSLANAFARKLTVIRTPTVRTNIALHVRDLDRFDSYNIVSKLASLVRPKLESCLHIVFVMTKNECSEYKNLLSSRFGINSVIYNSSMSLADQKQARVDWLQEKTTVMIATPSFLYGVDARNVQNVIFVGGTHDVCNYVQGFGRAGRDGQIAVCTTLMKRGRLDASCDDDVKKLLLNNHTCRRVYASQYMDYAQTLCKLPCGKCDICYHLGEKGVLVSKKFLYNTVSEYDINPEKTRALPNDRLRIATEIVTNIISACDSGFCMTCLTSSSGNLAQQKHSITQCKQWRGRCLRCGSRGHGARDCSIRLEAISSLAKRNHLCQTCFMPPAGLSKTVIHSGIGSMGKNCRFRDSVLPAAIMLFRFKKPNLLPKEANQTIDDALEYFAQVEDGVSNAMRVVNSCLPTRNR